MGYIDRCSETQTHTLRHTHHTCIMRWCEHFESIATSIPSPPPLDCQRQIYSLGRSNAQRTKTRPTRRPFWISLCCQDSFYDRSSVQRPLGRSSLHSAPCAAEFGRHSYGDIHIQCRGQRTHTHSDREWHSIRTWSVRFEQNNETQPFAAIHTDIYVAYV